MMKFCEFNALNEISLFSHFIFVVYICWKMWEKFIDLAKFTRPARHQESHYAAIKIQSTNRVTSNRKFHCPKITTREKRTIGYSVRNSIRVRRCGITRSVADSRIQAYFARRCTSDVTIKRTTSDERIRAAHEERGGELWLDFKASN